MRSGAHSLATSSPLGPERLAGTVARAADVLNGICAARALAETLVLAPPPHLPALPFRSLCVWNSVCYGRADRHDLEHLCVITSAMPTDRLGVRFLFYTATEVGSRCARSEFADQFQFQNYDHVVVLMFADWPCNARLLSAWIRYAADFKRGL